MPTLRPPMRAGNTGSVSTITEYVPPVNFNRKYVLVQAAEQQVMGCFEFPGPNYTICPGNWVMV